VVCTAISCVRLWSVDMNVTVSEGDCAAARNSLLVVEHMAELQEYSVL
jgi:hypothetical protein